MALTIAVSLMAADPLRIGEIAERAIDARADALHVDLGDGVFVPWLGGSVELVRALARLDRLPVDVHLMVERPEQYVSPLAAAGAASVLVHVEASRYPWRLRALSHRHTMRFGVAANPSTPISMLEPVVACADFITLLSTEPDDAGENILPGTADRVAAASSLLRARGGLEVDGGVNAANAVEMVMSGATRLVVGRAVLEADEPAACIAALRLAEAHAVA